MHTINIFPRPKFAVFLFLFTLVLSPQCTSAAVIADSIPAYLTYKDTVFISLDAKTNEKIYEHTIQEGQTLYSLARHFGLNEEELYPYNPNLKSNAIGNGKKIRIPIPNVAIKRFKTANFKRWQYAPIMFRVKQGDNIFKIAKTLFHMPVDSVVKWNKLKSPVITPNQLLHVGWISINGVPDSLRALRKTKINAHEIALKTKFEAKKTTTTQRGAAFWQVKGNPNTDLYCLHRTAPNGSIVEVTNMMNKKAVMARVIGKIPDNYFGKDIIIIVAPSVAKLLGARDARFFVNVKI